MNTQYKPEYHVAFWQQGFSLRKLFICAWFAVYFFDDETDEVVPKYLTLRYRTAWEYFFSRKYGKNNVEAVQNKTPTASVLYIPENGYSTEANPNNPTETDDCAVVLAYNNFFCNGACQAYKR